MSSQPLTSARRSQVLAKVREALRAAHPELFEDQRLKKPGGIAGVERHLDGLVEIVRRSTADRIEPYLAQIIDQICSHCPNQRVSGHCPLRLSGRCATYRDARIIVNAIAGALRDMLDAEYWANHFLHENALP